MRLPRSTPTCCAWRARMRPRWRESRITRVGPLLATMRRRASAALDIDRALGVERVDHEPCRPLPLAGDDEAAAATRQDPPLAHMPVPERCRWQRAALAVDVDKS